MQRLRSRRILVVEDDWYLAEEMRLGLEEAGAVVVGPVPTVTQALDLIQVEAPEGAILDVRLGSEGIELIAEALRVAGIPFVFATGYEPDAIPRRFADVPVYCKPVNMKKMGQALFG